MASLLGVCQPSGKIETETDISRELQGGLIKYVTKVDVKNIVNSKTIMMSRKRDCKIKSEIMTLQEIGIDTESNSVEDSGPTSKVGLHSRASVKSTVAKKLESKSALCDICSKTYGNKYILKAHMKIHERKAIGNVSSKNTLTNSKQKTQCQVCFHLVSHLSHHMKNKHGEKKFVTCTTCGQDKSSQRILEHEKLCKMSEDEKAAYAARRKVECGKCGKVLAHKHKLQRHIESVHDKSKLFNCEHCEHKDSRSDNMKTHMKNNHGHLVAN